MKNYYLLKKVIGIKQLLVVAGICLIAFTIHSGLTVSTETEGSYTAITSDGLNTKFFEGQPYNVPHDVDSPSDSTQIALSVFAWKEFIALNWPSSYSNDSLRGMPDTSASVQTFLQGTNTGDLVWHTYKHRVEVYPKIKDSTTYGIKYVDSFDAAPKYQYAENIKGLNSSKALNEVTVFNNLDETSEINLCTLFVDGDPNEPGANDHKGAAIASGLPGAPRRMIYEAKVNRDMFDYVVNNKIYDTLVRAGKIQKTKLLIEDKDSGAIYIPNSDSIDAIVFPFGENGGTEGSIEIKATWRQLTLKEYQSGRYLTAPIIRYRGGTVDDPDPEGQAYYEVIQSEPTATTLPYGLVGLHIIHKTKTFPSYVFATFEQVDNLSKDIEPLNNLFYYNRQSNPFIYGGKQSVNERANDILADTQKVNDSVHKQIKSIVPTSVWQYYKLIGVQGHPKPNDNTTDYYLANITTETNAVLANFSGTLDTLRGTKNPQQINIYQGKNRIVQGGCKGCHGNAQVADFSFITKDAPIKAVDFINQSLKDSEQ